MKFNKQDINHSKNLLKALGKGKWELEGAEVTWFSGILQWFAKLQRDIEMEVMGDEAVESARMAAQAKTNDHSLPVMPKPLEDPVKMDIANSPSKTKKSK